MAREKKAAISIQSYKPAKGQKIAIALKDGTEIVGAVVSQNANSIKLDDEKILRRKMQSISFRGRILAERATRGTPKSKKKKLSARTESGRPSKKVRTVRGRRKGRRGRNSAVATGEVTFAISGDTLVALRVSESVMESIAVTLDADVCAKLSAFGVPAAE